MALREIRLLGDDVLRQRGVEVETFDGELRALVRDMQETMYHAEGVGLAAPQIGVSRRVLVIDIRDEKAPLGGQLVLVNPQVLSSSRVTEKEIEGCLSIPGFEEFVLRPRAIKVAGFDEHGEPVELALDDLFSRAVQHEIDHLDGVLFFDRVSPLKRRMLLKKWQKSREGDEDR